MAPKRIILRCSVKPRHCITFAVDCTEGMAYELAEQKHGWEKTYGGQWRCKRCSDAAAAQQFDRLRDGLEKVGKAAQAAGEAIKGSARAANALKEETS